MEKKQREKYKRIKKKERRRTRKGRQGKKNRQKERGTKKGRVLVQNGSQKTINAKVKSIRKKQH